MRRCLVQFSLVVCVVILGCRHRVDPGGESGSGARAEASDAAAGRSKRAQRLDRLEAPAASTWIVTEHVLEQIGGDAKLVDTSWTVSEDGNHYAFAIKTPPPPEPEGDRGATKEDSPPTGHAWIVDGDRRIALRADDETLEREFVDRQGHEEVIDGSFFAQGPGRLTFTGTGGRFVIVAPAVIETWFLDDTGHRLRGEPLLLAFWKDGEFCGVIDKLQDYGLWGIDRLGKPGFPDSAPPGRLPPGFADLPQGGSDVLRNDLGLIGVTTAMLGGIEKGMLFLVVDLNTTGVDGRCLFHDAHAKSGFALPGSFPGFHARVTHVQATDDGMRWLGVRDGSTKVWSISKTGSETTTLAANAGVSDGLLLPNGGTLLVGESRNEGSIIVFNGVPQKRFQELVGIRTSPDGRSYVAITTESGRAYAMVNNVVTELPIATGLPQERTLKIRGLGIDDDANWRALISIGTGEYGKQVIHLESGTVRGTYAWTGTMAPEDGFAPYAFAAVDVRDNPRAKQMTLTPMLVVEGRAFAVEGLDPVTIDQHGDDTQALYGRGMAVASASKKLGDAITLGSGGSSVLTWTTPQRDQDSVVRINGRALGGEGHALHPDIAPQLSPSGRDAMFVAKAQGEWKLLANGQSLAGYDEIGVGGTRVGFTPQGTYTFLASRAGAYFWVEATQAR